MNCYKETYYTREDRLLLNVKNIIKAYVDTSSGYCPCIGIEKCGLYETDGKTVYFPNGKTCVDLVLFFNYNGEGDKLGQMFQNFYDGLDENMQHKYLAMLYADTYHFNGVQYVDNYNWFLLDGNEAKPFDMKAVMSSLM